RRELVTKLLEPHRSSVSRGELPPPRFLGQREGAFAEPARPHVEDGSVEDLAAPGERLLAESSFVERSLLELQLADGAQEVGLGSERKRGCVGGLRPSSVELGQPELTARRLLVAKRDSQQLDRSPRDLEASSRRREIG